MRLEQRTMQVIHGTRGVKNSQQQLLLRRGKLGPLKCFLSSHDTNVDTINVYTSKRLPKSVIQIIAKQMIRKPHAHRDYHGGLTPPTPTTPTEYPNFNYK